MNEIDTNQRTDNYQKNNNTTLFYFTGTGNSLWAARALAKELGNTQIVSMVNYQAEDHPVESNVIGLVFPVYIWGVPRRVLSFLKELKKLAPDYTFAIATNGGQVSNTLIQLKKVMAAKDLTLDAGWSVELPSNYIPWGGPGSAEEQNKLFQAAQAKISNITDKVSRHQKMPIEKGPLWQRLIFTPIYKLTLPQIPNMDKSFWVDERCDQCSLCTRVCPAQNIRLADNKMVWLNKCDQCLACLQWCPKEALQYGKKTPAYERYHHPEVKLKDLLRKS